MKKPHGGVLQSNLLQSETTNAETLQLQWDGSAIIFQDIDGDSTEI